MELAKLFLEYVGFVVCVIVPVVYLWHNALHTQLAADDARAALLKLDEIEEKLDDLIEAGKPRGD